MSYPTDHNPIEYLKRRIIYYKKKRGMIRNIHKDKFFVQQYGLKKLKSIQKEGLASIENRITEYEKALTTLSIGEDKF